MFKSRSKVRSVMQRAPPAESPARTIFSGGTAECNASGGGLVRYKSGARMLLQLNGGHIRAAYMQQEYRAEDTAMDIVGLS